LSINHVLTQYANNPQNSNSVLDLLFLQANMEEFNNYQISPDLWNPSDHASLLACIIIKEEVIQDRKQTIVKRVHKWTQKQNKLY